MLRLNWDGYICIYLWKSKPWGCANNNLLLFVIISSLFLSPINKDGIFFLLLSPSYIISKVVFLSRDLKFHVIRITKLLLKIFCLVKWIWKCLGILNYNSLWIWWILNYVKFVCGSKYRILSYKVSFTWLIVTRLRCGLFDSHFSHLSNIVSHILILLRA